MVIMALIVIIVDNSKSKYVQALLPVDSENPEDEGWPWSYSFLRLFDF